MLRPVSIARALTVLLIFPVNCRPVRKSPVDVIFAIRFIVKLVAPVVNAPAIITLSPVSTTIACTAPPLICGANDESIIPVFVTRERRCTLIFAHPVVNAHPMIIEPFDCIAIPEMIPLKFGLNVLLTTPIVKSDAPHV